MYQSREWMITRTIAGRIIYEIYGSSFASHLNTLAKLSKSDATYFDRHIPRTSPGQTLVDGFDIIIVRNDGREFDSKKDINLIVEEMNKMHESLPEDKKLDREKTFNAIVKKIIIQGKPSIQYDHDREQFNCMYRSDGGRKCAAGFMLNDDEVIENSGFKATCPRRLESVFDVINALQRCHDAAVDDVPSTDVNEVENGFVKRFLTNVRNICVEFGFDFKFEAELAAS